MKHTRNVNVYVTSRASRICDISREEPFLQWKALRVELEPSSGTVTVTPSHPLGQLEVVGRLRCGARGTLARYI